MTFKFNLGSGAVTTLKLVTIATLMLAISACSDDDDKSPSTRTSVRVIHTVPDAPPVNVEFNDITRLTDLNYSESSDFVSFSSGTFDVHVSAIVPGDDPNVIEVDDLVLANGAETTIFAVGTVDTNDINALETVIVDESEVEPTSEQISIAVFHAATAITEVDVYITTPEVLDAELAGFTPLDADYKGSADAGSVSAGSYRIRITENDDATDIIFDSGSVDLSTFAGQKVIIAAINTVTQTEVSATPIKLLAVGTDSFLPILDSSTLAGVKVVHLSPDTGTAVGSVEIFTTLSGAAAVELVDTFDYSDIATSVSDYTLLGAGTYDIDISGDDDTNNPGTGNFSLTDAILDAGSETTILATGFVANTPVFGIIDTEDDNRPLATHARLKVIHGAAAIGDVDVYLTASADDVTTGEILGGTLTPLLTNFSFNTVSDYVDVDESLYDVRVVNAGSIVIDVEDVNISAGDVLNVIAIGPDGDGDPAEAGLIVLNNNFD